MELGENVKVSPKGLNQFTHPWTHGDLEYLRANYSRMNSSKLADVMGRTYFSLIQKACQLGLKRHPRKLIKAKYPKEVLAYVAGLIDADGSVSILHAKPNKHSRKGKWSLRLTITNTSKKMIEWLGHSFEGSFSLRKRNKKWKDSYDWYLSGANALSLLKLCLPYLVRKKQQAETAIIFQKTFGKRRNYWKIPESIVSKRQELYEQMITLNKMGRDKNLVV